MDEGMLAGLSFHAQTLVCETPHCAASSSQSSGSRPHARSVPAPNSLGTLLFSPRLVGAFAGAGTGS